MRIPKEKPARKSTGGRAPYKRPGLPRGAVLVKEASGVDVKPKVKPESDQPIASGSNVKHEQSSSLEHSFDDLMEDVKDEKKPEVRSPKAPRSPRKDSGRAAPVSWSKEETKALYDVQFELAKESISRFLEKPELAGRNSAKINMKLKGLHAAAIKGLDVGPSDVKPR